MFLGSDENSAKIRGMLEDSKISHKLNTNDFVAIEINSDTESYMQFAQICEYSQMLMSTTRTLNI
jgi:hypothetical protein